MTPKGCKPPALRGGRCNSKPGLRSCGAKGLAWLVWQEVTKVAHYCLLESLLAGPVKARAETPVLEEHHG